MKLALFDKQKGEANVIDVNLERLKSLAEDGSISATLFNLYADESLKGDLLLLQELQRSKDKTYFVLILKIA